MEYGIYGDLIIVYPKPYSIYIRGTIDQEEAIREPILSLKQSSGWEMLRRPCHLEVLQIYWGYMG